MQPTSLTRLRTVGSPAKPGKFGHHRGCLRGGKKAIADVDAKVKPDTLKSFADVRSLIVHPQTMGEYKYGEEFEGKLAPKKSIGLMPQMRLCARRTLMTSTA